MQESVESQSNDHHFAPMEMVKWWEKRRYIYTAIIILSTAWTIYSLWDYTGPMLSESETIVHGIWLIFLCNVLYTSAWVGGILKNYYFGIHPLSVTSRWILFSLGSLFSIILIELEFTYVLDVLFAE